MVNGSVEECDDASAVYAASVLTRELLNKCSHEHVQYTKSTREVGFHRAFSHHAYITPTPRVAVLPASFAGMHVYDNTSC